MNKKGQVGFVVAAFFIILAVFFLGTVFNIFGGYFNLGVKTVSAGNFEKNYEYFKAQESAITQLQSQICNAVSAQNDFKKTYGAPNPVSNPWSKELQQEYADLTFIKNGYVSKYNSLVSEYNAKRSSFIQSFGKGQAPQEYAAFYDAQC